MSLDLQNLGGFFLFSLKCYLDSFVFGNESFAFHFLNFILTWFEFLQQDQKFYAFVHFIGIKEVNSLTVW